MFTLYFLRISDSKLNYHFHTELTCFSTQTSCYLPSAYFLIHDYLFSLS